jgi:MFS family permease
MLGSVLTAAIFGVGESTLVVLYLTRFVAGMGIGGEYTAINSMIDELIPSTHRGRADIVVNGTYWAGAALAGAVQLPLLSGAIDPAYDWRIALLIGPILAIGVWYLRRSIPESPRWQLLHNQADAASRSIRLIEEEITTSGGSLPAVRDDERIFLNPLRRAGYWRLLMVLFQRYPGRSVLSATLMITQSVLYNAIFFSYASVLVTFFGVNQNRTAIYIVPFALGNLLGLICLGRHRTSSDAGQDLRPGGCPALWQRVRVSGRKLYRHHADVGLVRHLLLRVGGRQRCVPDDQRGISPGGPG